MRSLFFILITFLFLSANAQQLLKGIVLDAEKNAPVPSASVFLSNTSIGTKTTSDGHFELSVPNGRYDLVVSSVGYATYSQSITGQPGAPLTIRLSPKSEALETVVIAPYEKDGWQKWGRFFTENFIGTSADAAQCRIVNTKAIRFRILKKDNTISAYADEPLVIENKALGYVIHYQMENFSYNFNTHYLLYIGYPLFEPMKGGAARQRKWEKRRAEQYEGSLMRFMRSLYRNRLIQDGFEVRSVQRVPNAEKERVRAAYKSNERITHNADGTMVVTTISQDTAAYYDRILAQQDYQSIIGKTLLPGDSIAYALDSVTAGLEFPNYLLVIVKGKVAPPEYIAQFPKSSTAMLSYLSLAHDVPIAVQASGNFYNPADLLMEGYWAWSEKMATMLPFDYAMGNRQ